LRREFYRLIMNYFELFDLAPTYQLDRDELQRRYRQLQQTLHPDRFARAGEREKLRALQKTSQLNDAYQTLRKPLTRAEYLLSLAGIDLRHEQQTIRDPEFLMAQMAWRERLEELAALTDIEAARSDLQNETQALEQQLEQQLTAADHEPAANTVRKLKFMHKLAAEIDQIEEQHLI